MAERDYKKMIRDVELGNPSSLNGVVSPLRPYYNPLRSPRHDDHLSSFGRASLPSDLQYSPSSSSSTGGFFSFSKDCSSPYSAAFDETPMYHQARIATTPSRCSNPNPKPYSQNQGLIDDLRLTANFSRMNIGDNNREERAKTRVFGTERDGYRLEDFFGFDGGHIGSPSPWLGLGQGQGCYVGDSRNSNNQMSNYFYREFLQQSQEDPISRPFHGDESDYNVWSQFHALDSNGINSLRDDGSFSPAQVWEHNNLALNMNSPLRTKLNSRGRGEVVSDLEGFSCEDSFIIEGKSLRKNNSYNGHARIPNGGVYENGYGLSSESLSCSQRRFPSQNDVRDYIYAFAKDHDGCRDLQKVVEFGTCQDVQIIFDEIIDHVVELSTNPFGNYLVQKLLDVGSELQKLEIVLMLIKKPGQLVRISLNSHGTRVVQKLIEIAKGRNYVSLVIAALEPGFLDLTMDLNGNHVLQRCLQCLSSKENAFIFDAATRFCVQIGTHKNGCCVLQKCIEYSTRNFWNNLVAEILRNALLLAQDPYGNYVVQFLMERVPSSTAELIPLFKGHFVHLSMQKSSSHVVEKFLKISQESHETIVNELLVHDPFERLLQDPFANYVISSALEHTKGSLKQSLLQKVNDFVPNLPSSPFSKKFFSYLGEQVMCPKTLYK